MLGKRLLAAAIIITVVVSLLVLDFQLGRETWAGRPGLVLGGMCILIAAMAAAELIAMWQPLVPRMNLMVGVVGAVAMVVTSCMPLLWDTYPANCPVGKFGWSISGLIIAIVIAFFYEMWTFDDSESGTASVSSRLARYVFAFSYLQMLFGFLAPHRLLNDSNATGLLALILMIATVKMSDAFAYFSGKSFGKHKLVPRLSPGKTVEGAIGSVFGGWFAAAIVIFVVAPGIFQIQVDKPWWWFLLYGFLITAAATAGDLAESLIKRDAGCKDSSKWLPGLGGVLDIADSLIFAAPVSYFLWI